MSDLFHPGVPDDFITQVFSVMNEIPRHVFQILTKRPERAAAWPGPWTDNIWMGTSVENRHVLHRISAIRECDAAVRFVSFEPLIGPVGELNLDGMHWVIVGGESGPNYRPMDHAWVREIRDQCIMHHIAFWFKQSAAPRQGMGKRLVEEDGSKALWEQYPDGASVQTQISLF
jgi:protein gp37